MRLGHVWFLASYLYSSSVTNPVAETYRMASSGVAFRQPPLPPHESGLGVQSRICCAENERSVWYSSECARSAVAVESAQQLPQLPWSWTSSIAARRPFHEKSAVRLERSVDSLTE